MALLLIPVADALPAVHAHLEHWPDDELPSPAALAELVALTAPYVRAIPGFEHPLYWAAFQLVGAR